MRLRVRSFYPSINYTHNAILYIQRRVAAPISLAAASPPQHRTSPPPPLPLHCSSQANIPHSQTRITTKYHIPSATSISPKPAAPSSSTQPDTTDAKPTQPIALLELKTFDPVSGTTLKYRTDKAAEVGRLIAAMGSLGREMAALPEVKEDVVMGDAAAQELESAEVQTQVQPPQTQTQTQQSTAGKKKKKGKK
jgi:hypothetical protein